MNLPLSVIENSEIFLYGLRVAALAAKMAVCDHRHITLASIAFL
ncbi:MAG: hypothetical protein VX558_03295 [Actinomycetota bacterium]|nr:hypothetical protein [Acidimicrobiales bacterium]MEC8921641.1 hypothetical protein [Actinomycetota bacterium]